MVTAPVPPAPLPRPALDSHTHLDMIELPVSQVVAAARVAGIVRIVTVGTTLESSRWSARCAREHDGVYAAVASVGGAPENPLWYRNLVAHPRVVLRDRDIVKEVTAREVFGAEKQLWWERAVTAYPPYAEYQTRTTRQIPVFVLE